MSLSLLTQSLSPSLSPLTQSPSPFGVSPSQDRNKEIFWGGVEKSLFPIFSRREVTFPDFYPA